MTARPLRWSALLAAGALAVPLAPAGAAVPPSLPGCERLVVTADFAAKGTAYCFGIDLRGDFRPALYRTTNSARTWQRMAPTGLPDRASLLADAAISPLFKNDRLLVAQYDLTVYYSVDAGTSFQPVPIVKGPVSIATTVSVVPDVPGAPVPLAALAPHGVIVAPGAGVSGGSGSVVFDPVLATVRVAGGSGAIDRRFAVSPRHAEDGIAYAVAIVAGSNAFATVQQLFSCDLTFSCPTALAKFPAGEAVDRVWFPGVPATSTVLFATTVAAGSDRVRTYVSRDGGKTFAPLGVLQRAVDDLQKVGARPAVALTAVPGRQTVFARVSGGTDRPNPPGERLYRSDDDGRSWRLVAYGRMPGAPGPRGTMPYAFAYVTQDIAPTPLGLLTYTKGRLLMTGFRSSPPGAVVWCSTNGGTRWTAACP